MKVEMVKNCYVGGEARKVGELVEVSTSDANVLIGAKQAVIPTDKPAKKVSSSKVQTRVVKHDDND